MNEKTRQQKQADAFLKAAPEIGGRKADINTVGKLLLLERMGNKHFGGDSKAGDIEAMTQIFYVATRTEDEIKDFAVSDPDFMEQIIMAFSLTITMEDVNEFGAYFETALEQINASGAKPVKKKGAAMTTKKRATRRTGSHR